MNMLTDIEVEKAVGKTMTTDQNLAKVIEICVMNRLFAV